MQAAFPDLMIEMRNLQPGRRIDRLVEGEIDAIFGGLQFASDLPARLVTRPFAQFHDHVVARADHPLFGRLDAAGQLPLAALLEYPWLVYTGDPIYEIEITHAVGESLGRTPDIRVQCESLTTALGVLQSSDCLSILPDVAVRSAIAPKIATVPVQLGRRKAPSGVIFREEIADWTPFSTLLDLCAEFFADHPAVLDASQTAALS